MKKVVFLLMSIVCLPVLLQAQPGNFCGTKDRPDFLQFRNSIVNTQNLISSLMHDTCLHKKFSIAFHVVLDSNYTWGNLTPGDLTSAINNLNGAFGRICVSFENCSVDEIPNYTYNHWYMAATETSIAASYNVENVINIYAVDSIVGFPAGYCSGIIVVEKSSIPSIVPIHEMGHFFGLPHTWAEIGTAVSNATVTPVNPAIGSLEFVRRTNCQDHGDGFCDTEADCYPTDFDKTSPLPCNHIPGGAADGWGDYYVPPVDNYMTYFTCGCRFSQQQYNFMAKVIVATKLNLH